ncbi:MAG: class I SAM-dependent methyltransferase [Draconibacterium sp.]|nr:class I SAM-dependent methyltransferase [Draconibacterium sp.]
MSAYKDYGWKSTEFSHAHSYLLPAIVGMLPKNGEFILDVGCGNGAIANFLIKHNYNVYGIDASEKGIEIAKQKNSGRFFLHDLSNDGLPIDLEKMQFKTIISTEVIEHLYDPLKVHLVLQRHINKIRRWQYNHINTLQRLFEKSCSCPFRWLRQTSYGFQRWWSYKILVV